MDRKIQLVDDRWCYACGEKNPVGLHLLFRLDNDNALHTTFTFRKEHQGYRDIVHGGFIGLILDEVMVNLAWRLGLKAVTAELGLRLKRAVTVGDTLFFKGWLTGRTRRVLTASSEARNGNGTVVARATAKCMLLGDG
jgi:acyl-coenzyme A thioesterase PaaI-like protein